MLVHPAGQTGRVSARDQNSASTPPADERADPGSEHRQLVPSEHRDETGENSEADDVTGQVEQPAKVMRIGTMIKQLLDEVRQAPLDEAGRKRLREIHESSIRELSSGLAPELREELQRITLPFDEDTPSEAELRVAQAQLVGWLEGLFHGIQTAIYAQQAQARAQLEQMAGRRGITGRSGDPRQQVVIGPDGQMMMPGGNEGGDGDDATGRGTGQYL